MGFLTVAATIEHHLTGSAGFVSLLWVLPFVAASTGRQRSVGAFDTFPTSALAHVELVHRLLGCLFDTEAFRKSCLDERGQMAVWVEFPLAFLQDGLMVLELA